MFLSAMLDAANPIDLADQAADDAQFFRAVLHETINIGVDHLRIGVAHAKSRVNSDQADPAADAIAYERVSRSIRRSILLAQRVTDPAAIRRRLVASKQVIRGVEDAIHRTTADPAKRDTLRSELHERLERPELLEDIDLRPAREIIADICRDLALAGPQQPYQRRTPADIAGLHARAAAIICPNQRERSFDLAATDPGRDTS